VGRYLDLFEKSFVVYNLQGYSGNLRHEITRKRKYCFYDTGVRNAVISNFNGLEMRNDAGPLWENFLFMERLKKRSYKNLFANPYFWRTWTQKEIDLIEERDGALFEYEFKWGKKKTTAPREWLQAYPGSTYQVIGPDTYFDFIL
jgi:predicted AAA+ superfamily ATPase